MSIDHCKIKKMFLFGAQEIIDHVDELTELDSAIGDGDHGISMKKIANTLIKQVNSWDNATNLKNDLENLNDAIDDLSGGSATPLFSAFIYGMAENANIDSDTDQFIKAILLGAYDEFFLVSKAVPGNKSMMDAIYPATEIIRNSKDNMTITLEQAALAAKSGSDETVNMLAKFGRARYIGERCLGHKDPGSVSFSYFYSGLSKGYSA
jgi:dihydroxyacetone kinase-like protein